MGNVDYSLLIIFFDTRKCEKMMGFTYPSASSPSSSTDCCSSSSPRNLEKQNVIVADAPSRFSSDIKPIVSVEERLVTYKDSSCNVMKKSSEDLRKEIASVEYEILQTEQYLLSLYMTAFDEQVTSFSPHTEKSVVSNQFCSKSEKSDVNDVFDYDYQPSPVSERSTSCPQSFQASLKALSAREKARHVSGNHTTLGDLLGSSYIVDNVVNPSKLSEEILRCISCVYCTLSSRARTNSCLHASSPSSVSWNPCLGEIKEANVPHGVVVESLKPHIDDGSFSYAALMLQNFRSLVQKLEKVDPSRMKREEKLAFWINIHNALTMHAYLAYGSQNRARNTSVLKAAYDVGGYRVNPYIIQSSILGICPHFSPPLLQTLFSPSRKSKTSSVKHIYALEYPEALAHFALSSGYSSDPPVRVYSADSVFRDLRQAKKEFIRNNVRIHNETKILFPKIVHYYAKDMSLDASSLMETMVKCLPDSAKKIAQKWLKEKKKQSKNIEFSPENTSFRFVIIDEQSITHDILL